MQQILDFKQIQIELTKGIAVQMKFLHMYYDVNFSASAAFDTRYMLHSYLSFWCFCLKYHISFKQGVK